MPDKEKILENYVEPDIIIEYFFIEKAENQIEPINDDQGYLMGFINLFSSGNFKNNNLEGFKQFLLDELNYSLKTYDHFKSELIVLEDYKFALIDNDQNFIEYGQLNKEFFDALITSLRNLMVVGKNFDITNFKRHHLFHEWFDNYTNRM